MSRWIEKYRTHAYRQAWVRVTAGLEQSVIADQSVTTSVSELARLKKVVKYIDGLLESLDPELIPSSTLDEFHAQASACADQIDAFNSNKNIGHVQNANNNADNLLTYIRPYMIVDGKVGKALQQAAMSYAQVFEENSKRYVQKSNEMLDEARVKLEQISSIESTSVQAKDALVAARDELVGQDGESGSYAVLKEKASKFEESYENIQGYYTEFFDGDSGNESKKVTLDNAVLSATGQSKKAQEAVAAAEVSIAKVVEFEKKVFGASSDGSEVGCLSYELEQQKGRLDTFELEQERKTNALNERIESLLPGATSAGLASAYREMKESFDAPIKAASKIFYFTIAVLIAGSVLLCVDKMYWFGIEWIKLTDWESVLRSLAYKLPFYGPAVWLAYYASKRRSEFQRLQQEYAHKEALAKSYDSFKKQVEALGAEDNSLMAALLGKAIDAISHNASQSLDGNHGDKMPLHEAIEKAVDRLAEIKVKPV